MELKGSKTEQNLMAAFAGESQGEKGRIRANSRNLPRNG